MPTPIGYVPDTGLTRFKRLRLGVVVLGVLAILAFAGSSAYDAWTSYRYSRAATEREIGNMANALAEQTAWILRAVDLLLLDTARWYANDRREIPPAGLDAALATRTAGVQQVRQVTIVDSQGKPLYWSREFPGPPPNLADRSYFVAQRDGAAQGMFMSEPLVTRSEGRTSVVLSRRLDDENGHFAGVIAATVDLEDLKQFYAAVNVGMGTAIQLIRDDGTLLVRNPRRPGCRWKAISGACDCHRRTGSAAAQSDRWTRRLYRGCARGEYPLENLCNARFGCCPSAVAQRDDSRRGAYARSCAAWVADHRGLVKATAPGCGRRTSVARERGALRARHGGRERGALGLGHSGRPPVSISKDEIFWGVNPRTVRLEPAPHG
jgi:hypothetical protein